MTQLVKDATESISQQLVVELAACFLAAGSCHDSVTDTDY